MKAYYDLLIVGSTFAGLGAAYAAGGETILVERTAAVGHEFINSCNPGTGWLETELSPQGERLKQELLNRNILSMEGKVHLPAAAPLLYHQIREDGLPVLLMTEVVNIREMKDGFEVDFYNASGLESCRVKRILDTTGNCLTCTRQRIIPLRKSINAMLSCEDSSTPLHAADCEEVEFVEGKLPGEMILKLKVSPQEDWITARYQLHQFWMNRSEEWKPWTIATVADCFEIVVDPGPVAIATGWSWLPSSSYRNPLEAFEAGYGFVGKEERV